LVGRLGIPQKKARVTVGGWMWNSSTPYPNILPCQGHPNPYSHAKVCPGWLQWLHRAASLTLWVGGEQASLCPAQWLAHLVGEGELEGQLLQRCALVDFRLPKGNEIGSRAKVPRQPGCSLAGQRLTAP
jgi:hypothetical protein